MPTKPNAIPAEPGTVPSPALLWLGMIILYVVWGSTYLGIAIAVETIPPFVMAGFRFLVAGLIMIGLAAILARGRFERPSRRAILDSAIVGTLLLAGGMGMVAWGQQTVASGIAALLVATLPLWIAILGRVFLRQPLPRLAAAGIVVGFVGIVVLVGPVGGADDRLDPAGVLALLVSPLSWSIGSLYAANRARLPRDPFLGVGIQMLAGSIVLGAMGVASGELARLDVGAISTESWLAFVYLVLIGSVVGFTTYGLLLRHAPLPLVATYAYVNPVVAVFLGWIVLGESVTARTIVAGGIIIFAVALIITTRNRMSRPDRAVPTTPPVARGQEAERAASRRPEPRPALASD
jgi:drug/metabolite transporter (DMT)-like permease